MEQLYILQFIKSKTLYGIFFKLEPWSRTHACRDHTQFLHDKGKIRYSSAFWNLVCVPKQGAQRQWSTRPEAQGHDIEGHWDPRIGSCEEQSQSLSHCWWRALCEEDHSCPSCLLSGTPSYGESWSQGFTCQGWCSEHPCFKVSGIRVAPRQACS